MDKKPKYSVIIPAYNAEKTLHRCLDSLLNQNYTDAEIILINDGSTDLSGAICREFAAAFRQITLIDKENGGVSSARNAGLDIASGKYILFVDSDDAVSEDYFTQLDLLDSHEEYDFLWFSYRSAGKMKHTVQRLGASSGKTVSQCATMFSDALGNKLINAPCNKRYKRKLIENTGLRFDEALSVGEDGVFNLQYALLCSNYLLSDKILYTVYVDNEESLSRGFREDLSEQLQRIDDNMLKTIMEYRMDEKERGKYLEALASLKIQSVYSEAKRMHKQKLDYKTRKNNIRSMCKDVCNRNEALPKKLRSYLLWLPVRLRFTCVIDLAGRVLAR